MEKLWEVPARSTSAGLCSTDLLGPTRSTVSGGRVTSGRFKPAERTCTVRVAVAPGATVFTSSVASIESLPPGDVPHAPARGSARSVARARSDTRNVALAMRLPVTIPASLVRFRLALLPSGAPFRFQGLKPSLRFLLRELAGAPPRRLLLSLPLRERALGALRSGRSQSSRLGLLALLGTWLPHAPERLLH